MKGLMQPGTMSLRKEMDRLFDRFWDQDPELSEVAEWRPAMDVSETKDALTARLDVPGMEAKDIQVLLENGVLTVKGEKKKEFEEKDERFYRVERTYGSFVRALRLPVPVDGHKVKATFKNGVLHIVLPKTAEAKGTAIPIQVT
jgi:HSP20 family protein